MIYKKRKEFNFFDIYSGLQTELSTHSPKDEETSYYELFPDSNVGEN